MNAGITVSPETAEIASARTSTESVFGCEYVGKSGNVVTVKMTNDSALDGTTYQIAVTLVDIYGNEVTTSNTQGFMGGITR